MIQFVSKVWGYEHRIANFQQEGYCGKILHVMPGWQCSIHFHAHKHETFFVTKGQLFVELWDVPLHLRDAALEDPTILAPQGRMHELAPALLQPGHRLVLKPFTAHRFKSGVEGPAEFIEFSSFDEPSDSYRVVESGPVVDH